MSTHQKKFAKNGQLYVLFPFTVFFFRFENHCQCAFSFDEATSRSDADNAIPCYCSSFNWSASFSRRLTSSLRQNSGTHGHSK